MDLLASEYGWSKQAILYDTYFDELFFLLDEIKARRIEERKIQLAIVQNPHVKDPQELWSILDSQEEKEYINEDIDVAGIERLKLSMKRGSRVMVK